MTSSPLRSALLAVLLPSAATGQSTESSVDFARDVLPILSSNCFVCHGVDEAAREAGLRLDTREGALAQRRRGQAVVPGSPDESLLISRILAADDTRMPPPEHGAKLSQQEAEILTSWIASGATWGTHWSFVAPTPQTPPAVSDPSWPRNAVDSFILASLDDRGLTPAPTADRETLIRRATFDLTGLPPTPAEIDAFVSDAGEDAYDRLLDRLLASPGYGEHQARRWLDLARYADSQGFEKDQMRTMWRYRDWVIDAYNADMPFDQFTREQIAGDLLDDPTLSQRIATGFHRNTQTNTEGGTDDEEFRSAAVIDRVNTTIQGWMGLTMGCAQCHTHKYDPIKQTEFFELYAFFNQTQDADHNDDRPVIKAPTFDQIAQEDLLNSELAALTDRLHPPDAEVLEAIEVWCRSRRSPVVWTSGPPPSVTATNSPPLVVEDDGTVIAHGDRPETDTYLVAIPCSTQVVTALRLEVLEQDDGAGPGRAGGGNFVINELEIRLTPEGDLLPVSSASATFEQDGYPIVAAIDGDIASTSGWAISPQLSQPHTALFVFEDPVVFESSGDLHVTIRQHFGGDHTLHAFRIQTTDDPSPHLPPEAAIAEILAKEDDARTVEDHVTLAEHALESSDSLAGLREKIAAARTTLDALVDTIPTTLVMAELPVDQRRETFLFKGGSFMAPDKELGALRPAVPPWLHDWPADAPPDRRGLAMWLTDDANPLTARVQINRAWEQLFGRGLVATMDDFGVQGSRPTHPDLMDHLALLLQGEFGWSQKSLLKHLMQTATYRQSSIATADAIELDPQNLLYSHAPRLRLSAEQVRDAALSSSGLLVTDRIGGPSVMPHLPDGRLPQAFSGFVEPESTGDDLHRRGLYTSWRRTGHHPVMATFDAPSREVCTIVRERSNTPLQALALLNDDIFIESAQALALSAMEHGGSRTVPAQIAVAFRRAIGRPPTDAEGEILLQIHDDALESYLRHPEAAVAMATDPMGPWPSSIPPAHAAAMVVVGNVIYNLDEFVTRP